jgi:hypothetical protein
VYGVFFLDTLITALATVTAWDLLAAGWGDLNTLLWLDWPFNALPALSGLGESLWFPRHLETTYHNNQQFLRPFIYSSVGEYGSSVNSCCYL